MQRTLVLDAMGVIYTARDDVAELLVPFITANNGTRDFPAIQDAYIRASLGEMPAEEFWRLVGVDSLLEDEYLMTHNLSDGVLEFLPAASDRFDRILCLSNDVSEWSVKLRKRFGLERFISDWFISSDLGIRKPSPEIYDRVIQAAGLSPRNTVFVHDRPKNLDPAQALGITGILFDNVGDCPPAGFPVATSFTDILGYA